MIFLPDAVLNEEHVKVVKKKLEKAVIKLASTTKGEDNKKAKEKAKKSFDDGTYACLLK